MEHLEQLRERLQRLKGNARVVMDFKANIPRVTLGLVDFVEVLSPRTHPETLWLALWMAYYTEEVQPPPVLVFRVASFELGDTETRLEVLIRGYDPKGLILEELEPTVDGAETERLARWKAIKRERQKGVQAAEAFWRREIAATLREAKA